MFASVRLLVLLAAGFIFVQGCGGSSGGDDDPSPPITPPLVEPLNPDFRIEFPAAATLFDDFERKLDESSDGGLGLGGLWVIYGKQQWTVAGLG